jgi:stalled ribosome alternative rescue factor ArfA
MTLPKTDKQEKNDRGKGQYQKPEASLPKLFHFSLKVEEEE